MTFWQIFFRVLPRRPLKALEALYWRLTGRKVRAGNRLRLAIVNLPISYELWIANVEQAETVAEQAPAIMARWPRQPTFGIIIYAEGCDSRAKMFKSIESLHRQIYPRWTLMHSAGDSSNVPAADFLVPLKAGNLLSDAALFRFAEALQSNTAACFLYGDHDVMDRRGRRTRPWFKPQWNAEMFLALDYVSQAVAIRLPLARKMDIKTGPGARERLDEALLFALHTAKETIVHVPHIISHVESNEHDANQSRREIVSRHLSPADALCLDGAFGTLKISWPLPSELPKVSIIIPTKDKVDLLRACIESVLAQTDYPKFEILVVDNNSSAADALQYLGEISDVHMVRVLRYAQPYNFSAINNFAVAQADGSYLCLLNNDTEVVSSGWLTEMMRYAVRPEVGAVGAKLLYGDGRIQHAGVIVGMGDAAGHAHRFTSGDAPGYFKQPHVAQFVSAVTAACLVVEKAKFEAVGGFNERDFAIAYNDVDFCLKLQSSGLKNVYVPHAILLHHETQSRGDDLSPEHLERYARELRTLKERWGTEAFVDPLHNPNLDRYSEAYVVRI